MNSDLTSAQPLRCPKCGSTDIAHIIYDPPIWTQELLNEVQVKKAIVRGGTHKPFARRPRYHCNYCHFEW